MTKYCDVVFAEDGEFRGQEIEAGETYQFSKVTAEKIPHGNLEVDTVSEPYEEDEETTEEDEDEEAGKEEEDAVATCQEVKSDGEVCGRERPCPYHD